jgi:CheY-like chemotaxis protein
MAYGSWYFEDRIRAPGCTPESFTYSLNIHAMGGNVAGVPKKRRLLTTAGLERRPRPQNAYPPERQSASAYGGQHRVRAFAKMRGEKFCHVPNKRRSQQLQSVEVVFGGCMEHSQPFRPIMAVVVEDDEDQRFPATLLEEADFEVVECETAEAGLKVVRERRDDVQLIFTDVQLPGKMDGIEFATKVHDLLPGVTVIVTSGGAGDRINELPPGVDFLPKPWSALDLLMRADKAHH